MLIRSRHSQKGLHTVEMAIVGSLFFIVLYAVLEFGRAMFMWNLLEEGVRRGARMAAVCSPSATATLINKTVFSGGFYGLNTSDADILVRYLKDNEDPADPSTEFTSISYVRVIIHDYNFRFLIPFFDMTVQAPDFISTLPRESLGSAPFGYTHPTC